MIPLESVDPGDVPEFGPKLRYLLGEDGIFVERNTDLFSTRVQGKAHLADFGHISEAVLLKTPKLTVAFLAQAVSFFEEVNREYKGEAALILLWDLIKQQFRWYCPPQKCVGMNVRFEYPAQAPMGCVVFGDFHSHPGMGPTPSFTDIEDERHRDGLHLIAGYIGGTGGWKWSKRPAHAGVEISATFAIDGARVTLDIEDVLEGIPQQPYGDYPPEWFDQVTRVQHQKGQWSHGDYDYA